MQVLLIATLVASVLAAPTEVSPQTSGGGGGGGGGGGVCRGFLYSNPICCATDILGLACLDGDTPPETPRDAKNFKEICAKNGQQARCCVLPIIDQAVLCIRPLGV
ncbi:Hydrophobin 2 [Cordyceps militaris CM01]|uniref:Class II hydrophobin 1 n=2 Tax=Cordyceps militaris TaxID=73501 RepID=HYD1_CORMI|nr:Hydrophobin 2 [Cordyceps militaris CM01]ATY60554.1 Hydrophobin 2 [Cordyceps militaris]EGX95265.1 Hydrophobin 2 [Cordyceps militaris CM01]